MKKLGIFIVGSFLAFNIQAEVIQWSQGFTADCDNPTERVDGTPLAVGEIANVYYYIDSTDGNITSPVYTTIMTGGCTPTFVDTKQFNIGTTYYRYGVTEDTEGQLSVVSSPGVPFTVQKAKPKPPSNIQ